MTTAERNALVQQNGGLAYGIAKRLHATDPMVQRLGSLEDVEQEALIALTRAVEGFKPELGYKFSTYATATIQRRLQLAARHSGLIGYPTSDDTRSYCGGKYHALLTAALTCWPLPTDTDGELLPLPDTRCAAEPDHLEAAIVRRAVGCLPARWRSIVRRRFGFGGGKPETLQEIADSIGVSRERVRQLEAKALARVKELLERWGLREAA